MPSPHLLTVAEMQAADQAAIAAGTPGTLLMERAGRAIALAILERFPPQSLQVYCGPGNNGGDGFVVARHLQEAGWPVRLWTLVPIERYRGDAAHHAALWTGPTQLVAEGDLPQPEGLIIDALFGAGLDRPLAGLAQALVRAWSAAREKGQAKVVAVDLPSGLNGDSGQVLGDDVCPAVLTVTFCRRKPGHLLQPGRGLCGEQLVADIGISDAIVEARQPQHLENRPALWESVLVWRDAASHKYRHGALVIRGGAEMTGAGRLALRSALRGGTGLVTLAAPRAVLPSYALSAAAAILAPCETSEDWAGLLSDTRVSALLIGPGNGLTEGTEAAVTAALESAKPTLLDGDALTRFAGRSEELAARRRGALVITPHEGEFARLFPDLAGPRISRAKAAAARLGGVVVLKGSDTIVADPGGRCTIADNAPPGLAVAGVGDVLAGLLAGLLAQGLDPFLAAAAAVWLHGEAGKAVETGLLADDLPEGIPALLTSRRKNLGMQPCN
ncbi:MAG: NAD(P)H-hydrate dehydratase [Pseudomonadota bacterium]